MIRLTEKDRLKLKRLKVLSESLANVDWGCNHVACPVKTESGLVTTHKKCCSHCYREQGYHHPRMLKILEERYPRHPKNGWWKYQVGCVLPRHLRSAICQRFQCYRAEKKTHKVDLATINKSVNAYYKLERD